MEFENSLGEAQIRERFQWLVNTRFSRELWLVEAALMRVEGRKVTRRTIQSWLSPTDRTSSRRCPAWAVTALENYLSENPDTQARANRSREDAARPNKFSQRLLQSLESDGNMQAESQIVEERKLYDRVVHAPANKFAAVIAEEIIDLKQSLFRKTLALDGLISTIQELSDEATIKDLKKSLTGTILDIGLWDSRLNRTKSAIEKNAEEFSGDDGTLPKT